MTYEKANEYALYMPEMKHMYVTVRQLDTYNDNSWYATYAPNQAWVLSMMHSMKRDNEATLMLDYELRESFKKDAKTPPNGRTQKAHNIIAHMNRKGKRCHF